MLRMPLFISSSFGSNGFSRLSDIGGCGHITPDQYRYHSSPQQRQPFPVNGQRFRPNEKSSFAMPGKDYSESELVQLTHS